MFKLEYQYEQRRVILSLIPAFEIGIWNAWILMMVVVFSAVPSFILKGFSKGDLKKRLSEIPANPSFSRNEKG